MLGFKSFNSAKKTLSGIEAMHIIKKVASIMPNYEVRKHWLRDNGINLDL